MKDIYRYDLYHVMNKDEKKDKERGRDRNGKGKTTEEGRKKPGNGEREYGKIEDEEKGEGRPGSTTFTHF